MTPEEKAQKKARCKRKLDHRRGKAGFTDNVQAIERAMNDGE